MQSTPTLSQSTVQNQEAIDGAHLLWDGSQWQRSSTPPNQQSTVEWNGSNWQSEERTTNTAQYPL